MGGRGGEGEVVEGSPKVQQVSLNALSNKAVCAKTQKHDIES